MHPQHQKWSVEVALFKIIASKEGNVSPALRKKSESDLRQPQNNIVVRAATFNMYSGSTQIYVQDAAINTRCCKLKFTHREKPDDAGKNFSYSLGVLPSTMHRANWGRYFRNTSQTRKFMQQTNHDKTQNIVIIGHMRLLHTEKK